MTIRILIADDQGMVREGLHCLLERHGGFQVVGEAADGRQAVDLALKHRPTVTLMDVAMPGLNGVEATRQLREQGGNLTVLATSVRADSRLVGQMLRAGASGYVFKDSPFEELVRGVRVVADGGTYLSAQVAGMVVSSYVRGDGQSSGPAYELLTPREREVLQLLSEGHAGKQIARQLNVSIKTVGTYRCQMMRKLQLRGLADLTRYALREGISTLDA